MSVFRFKQFDILQAENAMKVGTDAMVLGAFIDAEGRQRGLDIGAGTGVLSLMVAQKNPKIHIDAIELDERSAEECRVNFQNSSWNDRLKAEHGDFLDYPASRKYDLIFSNPPYYESRLVNEDERKAKARHEEHLPVSSFVKQVSRILSPNGDCWIIVPAGNETNWIHHFSVEKLYLKQKVSVCGKEEGEVKRVILVFSGNESDVVESKFSIRDRDGNYTESYKTLTRIFHFNRL